MPNLVLEKGGQTYRFGLHEEKSVTRGKYITVPFNGRDYYARYGDVSTPLKIEKDGRPYSVQYEPVDFQTISERLNAYKGETKTMQVYFAKGHYKVTMRLGYNNEYTIYISEYGNQTIIADARKNYKDVAVLKLQIGGVFNKTMSTSEDTAYFTIERLGD
jgi:hypothetical protein|nr:MAG TPA: hypothetical protein [Caudoviricetes sp.]